MYGRMYSYSSLSESKCVTFALTLYMMIQLEKELKPPALKTQVSRWYFILGLDRLASNSLTATDFLQKTE